LLHINPFNDRILVTISCSFSENTSTVVNRCLCLRLGTKVLLLFYLFIYLLFRGALTPFLPLELEMLSERIVLL